MALVGLDRRLWGDRVHGLVQQKSAFLTLPKASVTAPFFPLVKLFHLSNRLTSSLAQLAIHFRYQPEQARRLITPGGRLCRYQCELPDCFLRRVPGWESVGLLQDGAKPCGRSIATTRTKGQHSGDCSASGALIRKPAWHPITMSAVYNPARPYGFDSGGARAVHVMAYKL